MRDDAWRFAAVFLVCYVVGAVTGQHAIVFAVGLSLFIFWQYNELLKLLAWLKKRHQSHGPEQTGIIDDICREIDYARLRHSSREKKLGNFLKRFQKATGALPDAVIVLGLNGEIDWANKKAEQYFGIKWPQDSGLRAANLIRVPELASHLKSGKKRIEKGLQMSSPVDGSVQLEIRISPYGDRQQLLVARDITGISKANQMRKDFIANASHELRTPLTVISGYLESFVDDEVCPREWKTHIRQMRTQATRMQNLIEDLLTLSTLEASEDDSTQDVVRVPDMLSGIYNEAKTLSGVMQHNIELEVEPRLYVSGNHAQLYSAFSNIVFNAIQYTPERGKVSIRWYSDDRGAHMEVRDNGLGIAAEHIPRLTERFYRIDKGRSREKGGTGLGLAIVKHVIAKHGGNLAINSKPGEGSVFRCNLPVSRIVPAVTTSTALDKDVSNFS
ncbi:MAG: phosphate regulon sensor histidine kinase PhoR [Gammaproteobacteria bacterium]